MHEKSIEILNRAVADELSAVHQYMYFHFHCDDQGLDILARLFKRTAIEEMMHIERVAERILFLKGEVNLTASIPVQELHDVKDMLARAKAMEEQSIADYNRWAAELGGDSTTRKLLESLVTDEERHYSQYDTETENIARYGGNYLAQQAMERSRSVATKPPGAGAEGE